MNKILVTGGAGYIGSHCVLELLQKGYSVVILDNLSTGHLETINALKKYGNLDFYKVDLLNPHDLNKVFKENIFDAVIHFAAFSQVGESVLDPQKYYINNVIGALNLFKMMIDYKVDKIVFSSSAATYGIPNFIPITEEHTQNPINPYGSTKLYIENILKDYSKTYGIHYVSLGYFNVVGASSLGCIGEIHEPETHLVPNILKSIFNKENEFCLFGDDYPTFDGTCIRDYVDVEDLADGHILALEYLFKGGGSTAINLGTNKGNSVKEVFEACEKITNQKISLKIYPRREGDPPILVADNNKARQILNWHPKRNLSHSIKNAFCWEQVNSKNNYLS